MKSEKREEERKGKHKLKGYKNDELCILGPLSSHKMPKRTSKY